MNTIVNSEGTHEVLVLDSKTIRFWNVKEYALRWQLHNHGQEKFVPRPDTDPTLLVRFTTPLNIVSTAALRREAVSELA